MVIVKKTGGLSGQESAPNVAGAIQRVSGYTHRGGRVSFNKGWQELSGEMYCPASPLGGGLWGLEEAGQSSGASTRFT